MRKAELCDVYDRMVRLARQLWFNPRAHFQPWLGPLSSLTAIQGLVRWLMNVHCIGLVPRPPEQAHISNLIAEGEHKLGQAEVFKRQGERLFARVEQFAAQPRSWNIRGLISPDDRKKEAAFQVRDSSKLIYLFK